ncbi:MAG: hypothetical protein ACRD2X_21895, partial [Vicinamibacteraceae bacterium]
MLETDNDAISTDIAMQERVNGEAGGTYLAIAEHESPRETLARRIAGIVDASVLVHEEQKHV